VRSIGLCCRTYIRLSSCLSVHHMPRIYVCAGAADLQSTCKMLRHTVDNTVRTTDGRRTDVSRQQTHVWPLMRANNKHNRYTAWPTDSTSLARGASPRMKFVAISYRARPAACPSVCLSYAGIDSELRTYCAIAINRYIRHCVQNILTTTNDGVLLMIILLRCCAWG